MTTPQQTSLALLREKWEQGDDTVSKNDARLALEIAEDAEMKLAEVLDWVKTSRERVSGARELTGHGGMDFWDGMTWADDVVVTMIEGVDE